MSLLFYWVGWLFWIMITFFFRDATIRSHFGVLTLLIISLSQSTITVLNLEIYLSYLLLLLIFLTYMSGQKKKLNLFLNILFITFSYTGLRYIMIISPVWLFVPYQFILIIIYTSVALIINRNWNQRYLIACVPVLLGEYLYCLTLLQLDWAMSLGGIQFISQVFTQVGLLFIFEKGFKIKRDFYEALRKISQKKREIIQRTAAN